MSANPISAESQRALSPTHLRQQLRAKLKQAQQGGPALVAPGVFDGYGARMVQQLGFEAVYMTGNGVSASLLGRPDVGLVDLSLMSGHARRVASCVNLPLICDADTGYGNVVGVRRTIEEFEAAGVAAIHMEDQISPKRCAQLPGDRSVLPFREAVAKIEAAGTELQAGSPEEVQAWTQRDTEKWSRVIRDAKIAIE